MHACLLGGPISICSCRPLYCLCILDHSIHGLALKFSKYTCIFFLVQKQSLDLAYFMFMENQTYQEDLFSLNKSVWGRILCLPFTKLSSLNAPWSSKRHERRGFRLLYSVVSFKSNPKTPGLIINLICSRIACFYLINEEV